MLARVRWRALFALLPLVLGGCDPSVRACEDIIKEGLKAPSTYKRIRADASTLPDQMKVNVTIEYDAENDFGVALRSTAFCDVPLRNGSPDTSQAKVNLQI